VFILIPLADSVSWCYLVAWCRQLDCRNVFAKLAIQTLWGVVVKIILPKPNTYVTLEVQF
jgi:hypothetical protein